MRALILLLLLLFIHTPLQAEPLQVIFGMDSTKKGDALAQYRIDIIKLAMESSGSPYTFEIYEKQMNQARRLQYLDDGFPFNVAIQGTSQAFEDRFLPVRVPIYLGLGSGYRLMLIRSEIQAALWEVETLSDLRQYTIGQGSAWSDIPIWENAGFSVIESSYKNLFSMTSKGRFDLFSRGLFEAFEEQRIHNQTLPNLVVDEALLAVYPFAIYMFVSPKTPKIHAALLKGMQIAYNNGSLQALLISNFAVDTALKQAKLPRRTRIELPAYNMTKETILALKKYAFKIHKNQ